MPSHEWLDTEAVLRAKVAALAALVRRARHCVVYAGAGLSRASGIPDYASSRASVLAQSVRGNAVQSPLDAEPTTAHYVLAEMHCRGMLRGGFVQQNHDGLPQKAGIPQDAVNEIHGAWHDPANRVVQFNEDLRTDLFERLLESERRADLVLVVGTVRAARGGVMVADIALPESVWDECRSHRASSCEAETSKRRRSTRRGDRQLAGHASRHKLKPEALGDSG